MKAKVRKRFEESAQGSQTGVWSRTASWSTPRPTTNIPKNVFLSLAALKEWNKQSIIIKLALRAWKHDMKQIKPK